MTHISHTFTTSLLAGAFTLAALPTFAGDGKKEEHFDVWIHADGGKIVTGTATEDEQQVDPDVRVFEAEFGEEPGQPFAAFEPGFQTFAEEFEPFTEFTVNFVDEVRIWTDEGYDSTPVTMTIEFGPNSATTTDGFTPGFNFATDDEGFIHDHFDIFLNGDGGSDPEPGVYLLEMSLAGADGALLPSKPFWFVLNLGQDEETHEASAEFVEENFVAEPVADINVDGSVDGEDLGILLGAWGPCGDESACCADFNNDGGVDGSDLGELLGAFDTTQ